MDRRSILKGIASLPLFGAIGAVRQVAAVEPAAKGQDPSDFYSWDMEKNPIPEPTFRERLQRIKDKAEVEGFRARLQEIGGHSANTLAISYPMPVANCAMHHPVNSALKSSDIQDIVSQTLKELGVIKFQDMARDLTKYEDISKWLAKGKLNT